MSDYFHVNAAAINENDIDAEEATSMKENVTEDGADTCDKITEMQATSGIETKIENSENIRTQRRHFPFVGDNISEEVEDVIAKEIAGEADGGTIGSKAAAGIETKIENYENVRTQRRHFGFTADNVSEELKDTYNKYTAAVTEGETETNVEEIIESEATSGIETKIENYENIHTQRRHFPFIADNVSEEVKDTNSEEMASESEGEIEVDVEETIESEAAAGVETKIENYENIRTQRRHFPGSTTSNIFG